MEWSNLIEVTGIPRVDRSDGAFVEKHGRFWAGHGRYAHEWLRRKPRRGTSEGPMRTFNSADAAMRAVDIEWPL